MNEQTENTSGQGKDAVVPKEAQFYNYGAVIFGYFWLLGNGFSKWGDEEKLEKNEGIDLSPRLPNNIMSLTLPIGVRANIYAWKYKHWKSLEDFVRVQKRWNLAGKATLIILLAALLLLVSSVGFELVRGLVRNPGFIGLKK